MVTDSLNGIETNPASTEQMEYSELSSLTQTAMQAISDQNFQGVPVVIIQQESREVCACPCKNHVINNTTTNSSTCPGPGPAHPPTMTAPQQKLIVLDCCDKTIMKKSPSTSPIRGLSPHRLSPRRGMSPQRSPPRYSPTHSPRRVMTSRRSPVNLSPINSPQYSPTHLHSSRSSPCDQLSSQQEASYFYDQQTSSSADPNLIFAPQPIHRSPLNSNPIVSDAMFTSSNEPLTNGISTFINNQPVDGFIFDTHHTPSTGYYQQPSPVTDNRSQNYFVSNNKQNGSLSNMVDSQPYFHQNVAQQNQNLFNMQQPTNIHINNGIKPFEIPSPNILSEFHNSNQTPFNTDDAHNKPNDCCQNGDSLQCVTVGCDGPCDGPCDGQQSNLNDCSFESSSSSIFCPTSTFTLPT